MFAVPVVMPVTTPVVRPTVVTAMLLLFQFPPGVASASDIVDPIHTDVGPVIAAGGAYTVIGNVAIPQVPTV